MMVLLVVCWIIFWLVWGVDISVWFCMIWVFCGSVCVVG